MTREPGTACQHMSFSVRPSAIRAAAAAFLILAATAGDAAAQLGALFEGARSANAGSETDRYFEVDSLATVPPRESDGPVILSTPQKAFQSFYDAARAGDFHTASRALDLSLIDPDRRLDAAPDLARKLSAVLDRKVWVRWSDLPDRPDGVDTVASSRNPVAGEPRRSIIIAILSVGEREAEIRINRIKPEGAAPVWLIADTTVYDVNALYGQYGPSPFEQDFLPGWMSERAVLGLRVWEFLALPLVFAGAVAVFLLTKWIWRLVERRFADGEGKGRILRSVRLPMSLLAAVLVLAAAVGRLVSFSGPIDTVLTPVLIALIVGLVLWGGVTAMGRIVDIATERYVGSIEEEEADGARRIYTNISFARRLFVLLVLVAGVGFALVQMRVFQTFGITLLGTAGILTLMFGFAAQTVLGNILASFQIALAKPVRIGDTVMYKGEWGRIEAINYTFIQIRIWDQRRLVVPVKYFISEPFENWSTRDPHLLVPIEVKLDFRADVEAIRPAFERMVREDPDWDGRQEPKVLVIDNDAETITARFYASAENPALAWTLGCRLREQLFRKLAEGEFGDILPRERHILIERPAAAGGADRGTAEALRAEASP